MRWVSSIDKVPEDGEEVLIKAGEEYALAVYDAGQKAFTIKRNDVKAKLNQLVVYWMRLIPPKEF